MVSSDRYVLICTCVSNGFGLNMRTQMSMEPIGVARNFDWGGGGTKYKSIEFFTRKKCKHNIEADWGAWPPWPPPGYANDGAHVMTGAGLNVI